MRHVIPFSSVRRVSFVRFVLFAVPFVIGGIASLVQGGEPGAGKGDWAQFLGPNRNGISSEAGLLTEWPADGPKELWRVPGGVGMSGLAIRDGKLFTLVQKSERQWLVCLDATTGKPVWEADLAPEYRNPMGDGPRGTPTLNGDAAFVFTGEGILAAVKIADGKIAWQKNVVEELSGETAEYGMACSPIVAGENVIVTTGVPGATVAAFHRQDGKLVWKHDEESTAGYSSPTVMSLAGREQLVVFFGTGAAGLDVARGYPLWNFPYATDFNCNIATPVNVGGGVLLSAGENHGSVLLDVISTGKERQYKVQPKWESFGPKSVLRSEWQTPIAIDGALYGFDNVGGAGPISHLTCIDSATGKQNWQKTRFGKGNLIAADGKLFISTMQGELVVARINAQKYEELGRKQFVGKTRQAPALSQGRIYLRDDREIVCIDVRKK